MWDLSQSVSRLLNDHVAPVLRSLHAPLDAWIAGLPAWASRGCAVGLFALAALGTLAVPRRFVYRDCPDQSPWRDLRLWGLLVLTPYVLIYLFL